MHTQNRAAASMVVIIAAAASIFSISTGLAQTVAPRPPSQSAPNVLLKPGTGPRTQPAAPAPRGPAALIPRAAFFGNPEKTGAQVSPDGSKVSWLAPVAGVMNIWVAPSGKPADAKAVTAEPKRGVRRYFWAHSSGHVVYLQDTEGDENWHAFAVDLATGKAQDLTPYAGVSARVMAVSEKFPDEIVLGMNDRDRAHHDVHRVNIRTGERTLVLRNDEYADVTVDDDFRVRFVTKMNPDGSLDEFRPVEGAAAGAPPAFEKHQTIPHEDVQLTGHIGFDKGGKVRYMTDTRGRDTAALLAVDLAAGTSTVLFQHDLTDTSTPLIHPREKTVQAVRYCHDKPRWSLRDRDLEKDWQFMRKQGGEGELRIPSRSMDDRLWIVEIAPDDGSPRTYLYDRGGPGLAGGTIPAEPKMTLLFSSRPALKGQTLAKMEPVIIKSRDGLDLVSYLTLPVGSDMDGDKKPDRPLPMVLNVHGGPWARDQWGYHPEHQWLANRGYAVLSVNFRGSTGFGKKFVQASKREWGGKMHDDLVDAVKWAVDGKVADPARVAIYGGSYGGYATLVGLTSTPDLFACGVDIVGVSNLTTFMKTIPPYWKPMLDYMKLMVGDDSTEEGRAFLLSRSPVTMADRIKRPLLIAQGATDPRVNKDESDQVVAALKSKNIPVTYAVYPDEGHGFARPENRASFYAVAEAFLAAHLGKGDAGVRVEPVGTSFEGSSIRLEEGAEHVPGVKGAAAG